MSVIGVAPEELTSGQKADPWEPFNRAIFRFNERRPGPAASRGRAYPTLVPELVRTGVSNVFGNAQDVWSAANHLLQGKSSARWR